MVLRQKLKVYDGPGTASQITARIKIPFAYQSILYQKLAKKATQLHLLGMSYRDKSLKV